MYCGEINMKIKDSVKIKLLTLFLDCILAIFLIWILIYIYLFRNKKYKKHHYNKYSNKKEFITNLCLVIVTLILIFICFK